MNPSNPKIHRLFGLSQSHCAEKESAGKSPMTEGHEEEFVEELLKGGKFCLERIVSTGQVTPEGIWYDQDQAEWVVLLSGKARLRFEEEPEVRELCAGDSVSIPPHCRHRVEWTSPDEETVWLALHFVDEKKS